MTILPPNQPQEPSEPVSQTPPPPAQPNPAEHATPAPAAPAAPQHAAPQYQAPTPPPPGAPAAPAAAAHTSDPLSNVQVNYWLSVFFTWIPALIFYFIEKDKGQTLAFQYHVANLNFSLTRTIVAVAGLILTNIPYLGWLFGIVLWLAAVVLFIFHIIAASKASANYRAGKAPEFIFNLPLVK